MSAGPLTELAERVGITLPHLSILKTGKARAVRFTTLSAICAVRGARRVGRCSSPRGKRGPSLDDSDADEDFKNSAWFLGAGILIGG